MDAQSACIVDFGAGGHHSHFRELCARALRRSGIDRIVLVAPDCRADGADVDVREELSLELTSGGGYGTLWKNSRRAVQALETAQAGYPECGMLVLPYADLVAPSVLLHRPKIPASVRVVAIDMTADGALPRSAFPAGWRNGLRRLAHRLCLARMMASDHGDRRADTEFHDLLLTASGDQLVISLNRALAQFMGTNRNLFDDTFYFENWDELVQIHVKLYRAICAKDEAKVVEAVNEHYDFLLFLDESTT